MSNTKHLKVKVPSYKSNLVPVHGESSSATTFSRPSNIMLSTSSFGSGMKNPFTMPSLDLQTPSLPYSHSPASRLHSMFRSQNSDAPTNQSWNHGSNSQPSRYPLPISPPNNPQACDPEPRLPSYDRFVFSPIQRKPFRTPEGASKHIRQPTTEYQPSEIPQSASVISNFESESVPYFGHYTGSSINDPENPTTRSIMIESVISDFEAIQQGLVNNLYSSNYTNSAGTDVLCFELQNLHPVFCDVARQLRALRGIKDWTYDTNDCLARFIGAAPRIYALMESNPHPGASFYGLILKSTYLIKEGLRAFSEQELLRAEGKQSDDEEPMQAMHDRIDVESVIRNFEEQVKEIVSIIHNRPIDYISRSLPFGYLDYADPYGFPIGDEHYGQGYDAYVSDGIDYTSHTANAMFNMLHGMDVKVERLTAIVERISMDNELQNRNHARSRRSTTESHNDGISTSYVESLFKPAFSMSARSSPLLGDRSSVPRSPSPSLSPKEQTPSSQASRPISPYKGSPTFVFPSSKPASPAHSSSSSLTVKHDFATSASDNTRNPSSLGLNVSTPPSPASSTISQHQSRLWNMLNSSLRNMQLALAAAESELEHHERTETLDSEQTYDLGRKHDEGSNRKAADAKGKGKARCSEDWTILPSS